MIEVGDYVRTKDGIRKVSKKIEAKSLNYKEMIGHVNTYIGYELDKNVNGLTYFSENELEKFKHSKNIIDLIEKDDYVNGCRVYEVEEKGITVYQKVENVSTDYNWISKDEIETILTKEMYETNCYRLEE